jgi:hypothetical protein
MDLATVIKTLRLIGLGHVCRTEEQRDPKKALEGRPGGRREGSHAQGGMIILKMM